MTEQIQMKTGPCPICKKPHQYEICEILPLIVPMCDDCEARQADSWQSAQEAAAWKRYFFRRLPEGYHGAKFDQVPLIAAPIFRWSREEHKGGIGLIGKSGAGKSHAIACLLRRLETPFLWWSGTEARDAAILAATADKDRAGAQRKWEEGMTVKILVLDDISQGRMTEAWSAKLFDLLETRNGLNLPTFWTSQIDRPALRAKIVKQNGGDVAQSEAISRRISQHSLVLEVDGPSHRIKEGQP